MTTSLIFLISFSNTLECYLKIRYKFQRIVVHSEKKNISDLCN